MRYLNNLLAATHRFLATHFCYPLLVGSVWACALLVARLLFTGSWVYLHLVWNLVLAWIPYWCSLWISFLAQRHTGQWWRFLVPGGIWLLFLPNAPYLVTEFVHLLEIPSFALWFDIVMLATFAWVGCFLAVVSLRVVQIQLVARHGIWWSWSVLLGVIGLTGFGVYLGRFRRWNSWDILFQPHALLSDVIIHVMHPLSHLRMYGVTLAFAALLFVCYISWTAVAPRAGQLAHKR